MKSPIHLITSLSSNDSSPQRVFDLIDKYYLAGYLSSKKTLINYGPDYSYTYTPTLVTVTIPTIDSEQRALIIDSVQHATIQVLCDVYLDRDTPGEYPSSVFDQLKCELFKECVVEKNIVIEIPKKRVWFQQGDKILEGHVLRKSNESFVISSNGSQYTVLPEAIFGETREEYAV